MAKQKPGLSLMPWEGGLALDGTPDIKHPGGLSLAEDIVYDLAGAKHRRGGQAHLHRVAIREGTAFEDHFLDVELDEKRWPESLRSVHANHFVSAHRRSVVRFSQKNGTTGGTSTIDNITKGDAFPTNKMKHLVQTLSSDDLEAESQATVISIQYRIKAESWPTFSSGAPTQDYFGVEVEPGRPGDADLPEWHFHVRFGGGAMAVRDESGAFASVSFTSPFSMNALSVNSTFSTLKGQNWHTWRFDIKRNADTGSPAVRHYVCDVYYEDHKVASDVPVDNDSVAGTTFVRMEMDTTGDAAGATDVEVDSLDIQAEVQEIRGLFEFSEDPTDIEGATRKRAIYAGSRIYLDIGNAFNIPCIDDGLDKDQFCSFEVFESRIRPFRLDALRTQSTT